MVGLQRNLPNNVSSQNSELLFGVFKQFIIYSIHSVKLGWFKNQAEKTRVM